MNALNEHIRRRIRPGRVQTYLSLMRSLEFIGNKDFPERIVFSKRYLMDGQHRLTAIILLGKPVVINTVTAVSEEYFKHMGAVLPRMPKERLRLHEDPFINGKVIEQINVILKLHNKSFNRTWTPGEYMTIFDRYEEELLWASTAAGRSVKGITRVGIRVALGEYYGEDEGRAIEFANGLKAIDGPIQQARMMRDWALRTTAGSGNGSCVEDYERTAFCLRQHANAIMIKNVLRLDKIPYSGRPLGSDKPNLLQVGAAA